MNAFTEEDESVRDFCISVLGELLTNFNKYDIPYLGLSKISKALFVLSNYPKETINGGIEISASTRLDEGMDFAKMDIVQDYFELSIGGSVYTEGIGSDSFSRTIYSSTNGLEGNLAEWEASFRIHKYNLKIEDECELETNSKGTDLYENIALKLAESIIRKIVNKTISALQKDKTKLSCEDSVLENVWDEICVQVQDQHSIFWSLYEDHAYRYISEFLEKLQPFEKSAIWMQTEAGLDWYYGNRVETLSTENPFNQGDIIQHIQDIILNNKAANWTNNKIRAYLDIQCTFDG